MANNNKMLNKQIFKKWWFWIIVLVVLGAIGLATGGEGANNTANTTDNGNSNSTQTGTLPTVDEADYTNKEGLVAFKELTTKGYTVTAKYINEAVPATNQDLTEQFTGADANSCQDRLGFDAYLVADVAQTGDSVLLSLTNKPTSNQTCPSGTVNDL